MSFDDDRVTITPNDPNATPPDPALEAAEALLYGDPAQAAEKLRHAIHAEATRLTNQRDYQQRIRSEHAPRTTRPSERGSQRERRAAAFATPKS